MLNLNKFCKKERTIFQRMRIYWKLYQRRNMQAYRKFKEKQKGTYASIKKHNRNIDIENKQMLKSVFKRLLKFIKFIFLFILFLVPLGLKYDNYMSKFSFAWVFGLYINFLYQSFMIKQNHKELLMLGEVSELWKRYCKQYNPLQLTFSLYLALFIPINWVPLWAYILIFTIVAIYDLWYRRYLIESIKTNLILEKLGK